MLRGEKLLPVGQHHLNLLHTRQSDKVAMRVIKLDRLYLVGNLLVVHKCNKLHNPRGELQVMVARVLNLQHPL